MRRRHSRPDHPRRAGPGLDAVQLILGREPATVIDGENPPLALDHQPDDAPDPTRHHRVDYPAHPAM